MRWAADAPAAFTVNDPLGLLRQQRANVLRLVEVYNLLAPGLRL